MIATYGQFGVPQDDPNGTVTFTFSRAFGSLSEGTRLSFRAVGTPDRRVYLPVVPTDAEVVAVDERDRPALLCHQVGTGTVILCTYPLEHMAASTPAVNPEAAQALYGALAVHARLNRPVTVDDPRVAVDELVHTDGRRFVWMVSQSDCELAVKPTLAAGLDLHTLAGNPVDSELILWRR